MTQTILADRTAGAADRKIWQRVDAIARRFEGAWRDGQRPAIADFLPERGPDRRAVLSELIHVDQELRLEAREPTRAEPTAPFPEGRQPRAAAAGNAGNGTERRALEDALREFASRDPIKARLVQLRLNYRLSLSAAAKCLGLSQSSAERAWRYARAWLYAAMDGARRINPA